MRYWVDCSVDIHYPQNIFEIECDCCGKHFTDEHDVWQVGDKDYCWECWDRMEEEKMGMSRYDESCRLDALHDKMAEYRDQQREAMQSACESCENHNTDCPYFVLEDKEENEGYWEFEECFRDSGGWE